jgi:membrane protein implicated in regulation of membrane protease activity
MKGIIGILLGAILVAVIILGVLWLIFSGFILWIAGFVLGSLIVAAIIVFIVIFVVAVIVFFALFYYLAEKSPQVEPGEYTLKDQKGKND